MYTHLAFLLQFLSRIPCTSAGIALTHSFYWLDNISCVFYSDLNKLFSLARHSLFQSLATMKEVADNIFEKMSQYSRILVLWHKFPG